PQLGRFISEEPLDFCAWMNWYGYVGNRPLTRKDLSGLYDIEVHYYLTYYLALATGCFQDWEAREIGEYRQRSDEHREKKPGFGGTRAQRRRNMDFHSFGTADQNALRARELLMEASRNGGNLPA